MKPYKILWWTIALMAVLIPLGRQGAYDIQLHDTYFVMASVHVFVFLAIVLVVLGGIYWVLKEYRLNSTLSYIHSFGTSISLLGLIVVAILQSTIINEAGDYESFGYFNNIGIILVLLFLIVQVALIVNIVSGLVKGKR